MNIAITNHAVERFMERVEGAQKFEPDSVRVIIRYLVEQGFKEGALSQHPFMYDRRMVPFKSGNSILYLSLGPNTTDHEGDLTVIGVLFEQEATGGKSSLGVTIGDIFKELGDMASLPTNHKYVLFVGSEESIESYKVKDDKEMETFLEWRKPVPGKTFVYVLHPGFWEGRKS